PRESPSGFRSFQAGTGGAGQNRPRPEPWAGHDSQGPQLHSSKTPQEQAHRAGALVFELSKVETVAVRERMVGHLRHIDATLAERVARGLGLPDLPEAPAVAQPVQERPPSPPLSIMKNMKQTLEGRSVGILFAEGSDAALIDGLREAIEAEGAMVKLVAPQVGGAKLSDGAHRPADAQLMGAPSVLFDAVAVVLADEACGQLARNPAALAYVRNAFTHLKAIAVDAGGRALLEAAGVEPDEAVVDAADTGG